MVRERWSVKALILRLAPFLALAFAWIAPPAMAAPDGWRLCNQTSFILEAATGRPEGKSVIVEGWTRLRPGECRVALQAPIKPGVHFVFARSSKAHRGGQREWNGGTPLCIDPNGSFAVESQASCTAIGLEQRGFLPVRIDKREGGTMTFRETDGYDTSGKSALNAGLQRLLDDAGVASVSVDGIQRREWRAAVISFLAERKLPATTDDVDVIDILEDVARNRSLQVGMMLCNRTSNRITAAIARKRSDGWESRGWWILDAGACSRTVDESLIANLHYVYAEMQTPQGTRILTGSGVTSFCTPSRSKFAVLGREECEKRGFRQEPFVETPIPEDGKLVYEFFDRNFGPAHKQGLQPS
jgi:uncharacterized membrane protein